MSNMRLRCCVDVVIDHVHAAALAAAVITPAHLPQTASALNDLTHLRMGCQALLELPVIFVRQQLRHLAREDGCFDEHHGSVPYTSDVHKLMTYRQNRQAIA